MAQELRRLSGDNDYAARITRAERNSHQLERDPRLRRRWRAFLAYEDITGDDDHSDHLHEVVKMAECPAV